MDTQEYELIKLMTEFKKLKISSMFPNLTHGELSMLKIVNNPDAALKWTICHDSDEIRSSSDFHIDDKDDKKTGEQRPIKVSEIARFMRVAPPAVSRMLKGLEERGCILRAVDSKDRRNTYVEMTATGKKLLEETDGIMNDFVKAVFGKVGEENMKMLNNFLRELLDTAKVEIERRQYRGGEDE